METEDLIERPGDYQSWQKEKVHLLDNDFLWKRLTDALVLFVVPDLAQIIIGYFMNELKSPWSSRVFLKLRWDNGQILQILFVWKTGNSLWVKPPQGFVPGACFLRQSLCSSRKSKLFLMPMMPVVVLFPKEFQNLDRDTKICECNTAFFYQNAQLLATTGYLRKWQKLVPLNETLEAGEVLEFFY